MRIEEMIERAGGRYIGLQEFPGQSPLALFNDPETETTLSMDSRSITVDIIRQRIAESRRRYREARQLIAQPGGTP
jgi:hypothetical protein